MVIRPALAGDSNENRLGGRGNVYALKGINDGYNDASMGEHCLDGNQKNDKEGCACKSRFHFCRNVCLLSGSM